jgi:hypothetical protein
MTKKKGHQSYREENRIAGYFNDRYSLLVRAYAYDKNISKSDAIVLMCRTFMQSVSELDQKRMVHNYLKDLKLAE